MAIEGRARGTEQVRQRGKPVLLITGGSRGLGKTTALCFARAGWRVAVNYHQDHGAANDTAGQIEAQGGTVSLWPADISHPDAARDMVQGIAQTWGGLDVLINNAGITRDARLAVLKEADWDAVVGINLSGSFFCLRAAAHVMARQRSGCIVNIASVVGLQGRTGQAAYAAAKAGVVALSKAAARELGRYNVRVNAVLPGFLETGMSQGLPKRAREEILSAHCLPRPPQAEEVSEFLLFLARFQPASGQVFNLDSRIL